MKVVKTSAILLAMSAMLAGPALAQGVSSDTQIRGGAQGRSNMQGGASGGVDAGADTRLGAPGTRAGASGEADTKGTVGMGGGSANGNAGAGVGIAGGRKH